MCPDLPRESSDRDRSLRRSPSTETKVFHIGRLRGGPDDASIVPETMTDVGTALSLARDAVTAVGEAMTELRTAVMLRRHTRMPVTDPFTASRNRGRALGEGGTGIR